MTSLELLNDSLKRFYIVEKTKTDWKDYGIVEIIARDKYDKKRYKFVLKDDDYVMRPLFFATIPTKISQEIAHELAQKFNMAILLDHDNNGYSYFATLVSRERKRVGEITARVVTGEEEKYLNKDDITWSIDIDNYLSHYTFKITFAIIQPCVGFFDNLYPHDIKEVTIRKTYNIEKLKKTIFEMAENYKKKFDNFVLQESC